MGDTPDDSSGGVVASDYGARDYAVRRGLALGDMCGVVLGMVAMELARHGAVSLEDVLWTVLVLPVWVVLFKAYGLYDRDLKRISHTAVDDLPGIAHGVLLGSVLLSVHFKAVPVADLTVGDTLTFGIFAGAAVTFLRLLVRRTADRMLGPERVLLIGDGPLLGVLARKLRAHPEYHLHAVGIISPDGSEPPFGLPVLGDLGSLDLAAVRATHGVERIVVSHVALDEDKLLDVIRQCKYLSIKVSLLPHLFDALGPSVEIDDVEGLTILGINPPVLSRSSRLVKRSMDVVGALCLLTATAPLMVLIAAAIKLDSRGPVLFRQERVGKNGRPFRLVKFRTMVADADAQREALLAASRHPEWLLLDNDPRITRFGRALRLSSLDELPQLWNVLKGQMSLVGPRPLPLAECSSLRGWARSRLDLTPGITGLWQVLGRTAISYEEMIKLDYVYVTNWSLWNDVRLVLRTLPVVVSRRGAN